MSLAKWAGARVIATAGTASKRARALTEGADHVVDYSEDGWDSEVRDLTGGRGVDCVIDHTGSAYFPGLLRTLAPRGRVVICGATSGSDVALDLVDLFARQLSVIGSSDGTRRELMEVMSLLAQGTVAPVVDVVLPLGEAAQAQRRLADRDHYGRILLRP